MVRTMFAGALLILTAGSAGAQITTFIAPPRPLESRQMIADADSARRDSSVVATMANMKAWVDSASGVAVPSTVGQVDSAALINDPGRPITTFSSGTVAPATAGALPTLALIGLVAIAVGVFLLRKPQRS